MQSINDFFAYISPEDAKKRLNQMLDVMVTGSFNKELSCRERCNLVFFIRQLERFIEYQASLC